MQWQEGPGPSPPLDAATSGVEQELGRPYPAQGLGKPGRGHVLGTLISSTNWGCIEISAPLSHLVPSGLGGSCCYIRAGPQLPAQAGVRPMWMYGP